MAGDDLTRRDVTGADEASRRVADPAKPAPADAHHVPADERDVPADAPDGRDPLYAAPRGAGGDKLGAEADDADVGDDSVAEAEAAVVSDLDAARAERDDYLDALRRLQADFENYKKRMLKQQTDLLERAAQTLVEKLLHVLDAADLAIAHGAGEEVAQIAGLLMDTLVKEGLAGVDPKPGDPFDPTEHDAVAHEPGEGGPEVADLLRPGYRWKGTLLRPAMVKVRG
ncbi:MAG: nucleotide exchange factor GrpE [Acidimicrobiales bacterium]